MMNEPSFARRGGYGLPILLALLFLTLTFDAHAAERRVALVIGNSAYASSPLKNPVNDARDMRAKLLTLGFASGDIVYREDLKASQIGGVLREFRGKLSRDAVALVFYAGHGVQIRGENYLPTVDAQVVGEEDVPQQSLALKAVMNVLEESDARLKLVFLDACRNNPYARNFRSGSRGLARVLDAPTGTLIAYATRPGQEAADGTGRNGVFTAELLRNMSEPGVPVESMLKRVVRGVRERTGGSQIPWPEGAIDGDFYFVASAPQPPVMLPSVPPVQAPSGPKPGDVIKDCDACPALVVLPKGRFDMGSPAAEPGRQADEGPVHGVRIEHALAVGRFEVSRGEFGRFVAASNYRTEAEWGNGCAAWTGSKWEFDGARNWRSPGFTQGDDHPVVCVSWNDVQAYVAWLNGVSPGKGYRLLSEAEWEYAARAGRGAGRYPWGDDLENSLQCLYANGADRTMREQISGTVGWAVATCADGHVYTAPGSALAPNGFGLFHMSGNAWEWVQDVWHDSYDGAPADGRVWDEDEDTSRRVLRGGSWIILPSNLRSADRDWNTRGYRSNFAGFRVARTLNF